ncbi:hsp70 nucleotide exchange factor fes1 [Microbotryomycetes sp. JL201]|nr:hsp70 nucleotide exchange factor fes1 [Microbotryomycetes sp. JL201]
MSNDPSQSLLRWGIEHSAPGSLIPLAEDMKAGRRPDLNTDVLRAIMGTTDADRMRDCMQVIDGTWVARDQQGNVTDEGSKVTREDKLKAWDDLEMLVEDIDNAKDLKNLGLWPRITKHLTSDDDDVLMRACWVCGTAVQQYRPILVLAQKNNPQANTAFLEHDPLPTVNSLLSSETSSISTRNKAMYCLSSTLKHSPLAVARFDQLDGWSTLRKCLQDPSLVVRNKTAFLLSQLVSQATDVIALLSTLRSSGVISGLLDALSPASAVPTGPNGETESIDPELKEKALRFFVNAVDATKGKSDALNPEEKNQVLKLAEEMEGDADWSVDDLGLAQSEWANFKQALKA